MVSNLDEVLSILTQAVQGGEVSWETFLANVPPQSRRHVMSAIRQLESDGVLHRVIDATSGTPVFVVRPGARPE